MGECRQYWCDTWEETRGGGGEVSHLTKGDCCVSCRVQRTPVSPVHVKGIPTGRTCCAIRVGRSASASRVASSSEVNDAALHVKERRDDLGCDGRAASGTAPRRTDDPTRACVAHTHKVGRNMRVVACMLNATEAGGATDVWRGASRGALLPTRFFFVVFSSGLRLRKFYE